MHENPHQRPQAHPGSPNAGPTPSQPVQPGSLDPASGRLMQSPLYEDARPAAPVGPSKALLGLMAAGLLVAAGGIVYKIVHKPEPKAPVARAPSPWDEQRQMMREALNMAREAQQMQREHQAEMRQMMQEEYAGYSEASDQEW